MGDSKQCLKWSKPSAGNAKLNVDGSYGQNGEAGAGMVLRDHDGQVIYAACHHIEHCYDATDAELLAIEEGLQLSLHWSTLQFTLETDCAEAVEMIKEGSPNASAYAFRVNVIRDLIRERGVQIAKINRKVNEVSHELAKLGRVTRRSEFWLANFPAEIEQAISNDCNSTLS
jgi:ribonuclease HI